jgi:hypothetical protein
METPRPRTAMLRQAKWRITLSLIPYVLQRWLIDLSNVAAAKQTQPLSTYSVEPVTMRLN